MEIKLEDFNKYRPKLLGYSKALTRSWSTNSYDYEDIVQDSFISFKVFCVNNNYKLKDHQNLERLLINMTHFSYKKHRSDKYKEHRHRYNETRTDFSIFLEELHPVYNIENEIVFKMDLELFKATLNPRQLFIFNMIKKGYNQQEIANKTNISRQAVFHSLKYISKKFKKFYNE